MSLPYESARAGEGALQEIQKILAKFGCQSFGTMINVEKGVTIVQFTWHNRTVSLEASWKGYATAWMKEHPWSYRMHHNKAKHEEIALAQARISVCSILRDWVKGQTTAIECGIMSFEAAFFSHLLTKSGERVIDRVMKTENLLPESTTE